LAALALIWPSLKKAGDIKSMGRQWACEPHAGAPAAAHG